MSLLKTNSVQIGQSATATQNFTLSVPSSPDGTIKLARGNSGATTQDIMSVDASGFVSFLIGSNGGKVAQVVEGSTTTPVLVNTVTMTNTGLSVSITPASASNKILILLSQSLSIIRSASTIGVGFTLLRGATTLYAGSGTDQDSYIGGGGLSSVQKIDVWPFMYLDSPSTTSSLTYTLKGRPNTIANSGSVAFQPSNARSTILAIEVLP